MKHTLLLLTKALFVLTLSVVFLLGCSTGDRYGKNGVIRIGVALFNQSAELDQALKGVIQAAQESELAKQVTIHIDWADAGGERLAIKPLLDKFDTQDFDLLITLSTPCLEEAIRQVMSKPIIFGAAINPKILGLNRGEDGYWRDISGVYSEVPMEQLCLQIRKILPEARSVGVIWNPSEINSRYEMLALRKACKKLNFEIVETRIRNAETITQKVSELLALNPNVIVLLSDNTVARALPEVAETLLESRIPIVSDINSLADSVAVLTTGFDMLDWGKATGVMAIKALMGTEPKDIPLEEFTEVKTTINLKNANRLGLKIPANVLESADKVIK